MTDLARDFFAGNPAMAGPMLAMFLFGLVFTVAALRAWRASPEHVDRMARLALEGDEGSADDE